MIADVRRLAPRLPKHLREMPFIESRRKMIGGNAVVNRLIKTLKWRCLLLHFYFRATHKNLFRITSTAQVLDVTTLDHVLTNLFRFNLEENQVSPNHCPSRPGTASTCRETVNLEFSLPSAEGAE